MKSLFALFAILKELFIDKSSDELKIYSKDFDFKKWLRYILLCTSMSLVAFFVSRLYILSSKYIELERQYKIVLNSCTSNNDNVQNKIDELNKTIEEIVKMRDKAISDANANKKEKVNGKLHSRK